MKQKKLFSLASSIFIPFLLLTFFASALLVLFSSYLLSGSMTSAFKKHLQSRQNLFARQISQDLLSGADFEVYRKCKSFASDKDIVFLKVRSLDDRLICSFGSEKTGNHMLLLSSPVYFDENQTHRATVIEAGYSTDTLSAILLRHFLLLIGAFGFLMTLQYSLGKRISRSLSLPISALSQRLSAQRLDGDPGLFIDTSSIRVAEVDQLYRGAKQLFRTISTYQQELVEKTKLAVMGKIATQVAHDIRSPLSSLQAAVGMIREGGKAEDAANLLELSAQRLTGIADDLLKKHKGEGEPRAAFSLHQVLDELAGEFQGGSEYKDIAFVKHYFSSAIHLNGSPAKLQRAFGNIIKNAVEAMKGKGEITLTTGKPNGQAVVSITDTGPGMAPEILARVLRGGYTQGKEEGHGIGMRVVQETVEEFGGSLTAQSEGGKGTTFIIELPLRAAREEAYTLEVPSDKIPVLVVDDEPSIREQWRLILKEKGLASLLCASYEDVAAQKISSALTQTAVVDYHFDNSEKNGADVVKQLQLQGISNITLCTAEYWKPSVKKLADELNVKLCPKPLPKVVILSDHRERRIHGEQLDSSLSAQNDDKGGYKVLVIDDEEGIRLSWDVLQEKFGIARLYAFPNLEALLSDGVDLQSLDVAFVDKNIENSQYSGADVIAYLKKKGVPKVVLASGENEERLRKDPQFALADFISGEKIPKSVAPFL